MINSNRLDLGLVPIGGSNPAISCEKCPSACCRKDTALPLSKDEARTLQMADTALRLLPKGEWQGNRPGRGRQFYVLESDCGNLEIDEVTGVSRCGIHETPAYPKACREFARGAFRCIDLQRTRIARGEDQSDVD